ncbi:MAG: Sapep family Mn(2+)-dependent dipeptidase [Oscillospiraceae bacterium]|nr:Sapep family Mn(2+)-dependent dipeptidase [Oscillospiraceae bacterium]
MSTEIHEYIRSQKEELLRILGELVAIPSVMGEAAPEAPFGEEPKRALLKMQSFCEEMGFSVTNYDNAVLCADWQPDLGIELGILAHLDVVSANENGWDTDPFLLTEKNGVLYGRGVIDDKGPAAAVLLALKCVKELGIPLKRGVRLIFGTNEENGSEDLEIYKDHDQFPPKVFTPDGSFPVINIEKGMLRSRFFSAYGKLETFVEGAGGSVAEFHGGKIPNAVPDRAEAVLKDITLAEVQNAIGDDRSGAAFEASENGGSVVVVCNGKPAHASTPETGINAVTALISLINRLPMKELISRDILRALERFFPHGETDGGALGLKCSDDSGALTAVLSVLDMDGSVCCGYIDVRFPTCAKLGDIEEKERYSLERRANLKLDVILGDEPHTVPENSPFVQTLLSVYENIEGEPGRCLAIGGGTYVHNIEGGVAFGAERGDTDYHMHGDNEFVTTEELLKDAELFANVIAKVCG